MVFDAYAAYYNLLYQDKDYAGEAEYIHGLLRRFAPDARTLLELGAGTGRHAALLAGKGYAVHGIERSPEMLARARALASGRERLAFSQGDLRHVRLGRTFDAVCSLFHVISYQTGNADVLAALRTVREHLAPGGAFLFDVWYGPAVLTQKPEVRVKRVQDERIAVTRIAEPKLHPNVNVVDVDYHVFVRDRSTDTVTEIRETHPMRYFFLPEIELALAQSDLRLRHCEEWMTGREIGSDTWGALLVAEAGSRDGAAHPEP